MPRARIGSEALRQIHAVKTVVAALLIATAVVAAQRGPASSDTEAAAFVCPMHPDYTLDVAGSCPKCGMALVRAAPFDVRDYGLELSTRPIRGGRTAATPAPVRPGETATWDMRIRRPGTGDLVREFESVHEKRYHLFVISQDMEHFQHIHPELRPDGAWTIDVTLPKAGHYVVLSDFMPRGGSSQLLARPIVTAGFAGDLRDDSARLTPDTNLVKVAGDLTARVSFDPPTFMAGLYGHLTFHLTDTRTGRPVTDLQTYLGAFGHTLIMSEDMVDYVHAHSLDILNAGDDDGEPQFLIPPGADLEKLRGGPEVTFDGLMPKPGRYRAWTQFRRNDALHTLTTTFTVAAP